MTANFVFLMIVVFSAFSWLGYVIYRSDGLNGVMHYIHGAIGAAAFFVVLWCLHVGIHCIMETCEQSMFYRLLFWS